MAWLMLIVHNFEWFIGIKAFMINCISAWLIFVLLWILWSSKVNRHTIHINHLFIANNVINLSINDFSNTAVHDQNSNGEKAWISLHGKMFSKYCWHHRPLKGMSMVPVKMLWHSCCKIFRTCKKHRVLIQGHCSCLLVKHRSSMVCICSDRHVYISSLIIGLDITN